MLHHGPCQRPASSLRRTAAAVALLASCWAAGASAQSLSELHLVLLQQLLDVEAYLCGRAALRQRLDRGRDLRGPGMTAGSNGVGLCSHVLSFAVV